MKGMVNNMSVRQYIGARYVPIFDGDWSQNKSYDPLTIVQYMNSSYTSKKSVPAGVAPTNSEYWANTGNYNAQVEEYRQEVVEYAEDVADLASDLADYIEANNNVKMIKENPEIALIGDSSIELISDSTMITDFFNGAHVTNYSAGISHTKNWENIFSEQISQISTTPDIIYIWCGGNDVTTDDDWGGKLGAPDIHDHTVSDNPTTVFEWIKYCLKYIRDTYPNAEVFNLVRPVNMNKRQNRWYYLMYYQTMIMHEWCVPVIQMNELCNFTMFNNTQIDIFTGNDNVHWSQTLYRRALARVANSYHAGSPSAAGFIPPQGYYAPTSCLDLSSGRLSHTNLRNVVKWICEHCLTPGSTGSGGSVSSGMIEGWGFAFHSTANASTRVRFKAFVDFANDATEIWYYWTGHAKHCTYRHSTGEFDTYGSIITSNTITSENTSPWYNLDAGDYTVRASGLSTIQLPSAITLSTNANSILMVRDNEDSSGEPAYKYCLLFDARGTHMYKGYKQLPNGTEYWYQVAMTSVSIS